MNDSRSMDQAFVMKLTEIVLANLTDEGFGVEKLAKEVGMSRANLYRRLISIIKVSHLLSKRINSRVYNLASCAMC